MICRCLVILITLGLALAGCASTRGDKASIDEMERRHTEDMQRMGGGSGSM